MNGKARAKARPALHLQGDSARRWEPLSPVVFKVRRVRYTSGPSGSCHGCWTVHVHAHKREQVFGAFATCDQGAERAFQREVINSRQISFRRKEYFGSLYFT